MSANGALKGGAFARPPASLAPRSDDDPLRILRMFDTGLPQAPDRREVALLSDITKTLHYLNVPPSAVSPAAHLLVEAMEFDNQHLWDHVIMRLQMMVNKDGFRARQHENMSSAAGRARQERLEALSRLATSGPNAKAAPAAEVEA